MEKRAYHKPELTIHGDIEKITLAGCKANSDNPQGTVNDGNAYPVCS